VSEVVVVAERVARKAHGATLDKNGTELYILHPARIAAGFPLDPDAAAAAWLHDVL